MPFSSSALAWGAPCWACSRGAWSKFKLGGWADMGVIPPLLCTTHRTQLPNSIATSNSCFAGRWWALEAQQLWGVLQRATLVDHNGKVSRPHILCFVLLIQYVDECRARLATNGQRLQSTSLAERASSARSAGGTRCAGGLLSLQSTLTPGCRIQCCKSKCKLCTGLGPNAEPC